MALPGPRNDQDGEAGPETASLWIDGKIPHDDNLYTWVRHLNQKRMSSDAYRFVRHVEELWRNRYGMRAPTETKPDPARFDVPAIVELDVVWPADTRNRYAGRSIRTILVALAHARAIDYAYLAVPRVRSVRRVGEPSTYAPTETPGVLVTITRAEAGVVG